MINREIDLIYLHIITISVVRPVFSGLTGVVHPDGAVVPQPGAPDVRQGQAESDLVLGQVVLLGQVFSGLLRY